MAIAFVQSVKATSASTTSLASPSITPTTGNCLVAVVGWLAGGSNNSFVDSLGNRWGFIANRNQNGSNVSLFACKVTSSGALTITAGFSSASAADIIVAEYSGLTFQGAFFGATNGTTGTSSVGLPVLPSPSPTGNLLIAALYDRSHASTVSYSSGFTVRDTTSNPNGEALSLADMLATGVAAGGQTATVSPGSSNGLALALYDISTIVLDDPAIKPIACYSDSSHAQVVTVAPYSGGSSPSTPVPIAQVIKSATVGVAYSEQISGTGGSGTYTFSLTTGALPTGCTLNTSTGVIAGTPTTAGTFNFTIKATDSLGDFGTFSFQIVASASSGAGGGGSFVFLG